MLDINTDSIYLSNANGLHVQPVIIFPTAPVSVTFDVKHGLKCTAGASLCCGPLGIHSTPVHPRASDKWN